MKYLIDLTMLFEIDASRIVLFDEEESSIKLSNQASRLLYELITHSGQMVEREVLIKKVWEDQGFSGSSISLNVAISEIRKAFKNLGHDPLLIQTMRGKGFSLTAQIEHHTVRPKIIAQTAEAPTEINVKGSADERKLKTREIGISRKEILIIIIMIILICGLSLALLLIPSRNTGLLNESRNVTPHYIGSIDRCQTYLIEKNRYQSDHHYLSLAREQLALQKINCQDESVDVYFAFFIKGELKNYFLSTCYPNSSGKDYNNCVSYRRLTGS